VGEGRYREGIGRIARWVGGGGVCYHGDMGDLSKLLNPKSVAVIGASRDERKIGGIVVRNIRESGFGGAVYPVNPKAEDIQGLKTYVDMASIPETPELAVVALPANMVIEVLGQIAEKGTRDVVVFTAGFGEIGEEGKRLEEDMGRFCGEKEMNLLGPNCLGFVSNLVPINVTFGNVAKNPGNLRMLSQSGAIATAVFDWFEAQGLGFGEFITLGNKTVVGENEVLEYWLSRERGDVRERFGEGLSDVYPVGMYLESIKEGKRFLELVREVSRNDPVFVLKPGKSEAAAKAMQSHTGAIAGEDAVMGAALAQAGAIRCEGIEDLFDLARVFAWEKTPEGPRVAVVSNAGGPAVISADVIAEVGLELPVIDDGTHERLLVKLPRAASVVNPVDVLGDALAQRYADAVEILLSESRVQALVVILTPQVMTEIEETARLIGELAAKHGKPVVCSFMGGNHIRKGEEVLNGYKIPSFRYPERAIKALGAMWRWNKWRQGLGEASGVVGSLGEDEARIRKVVSGAKEGGRGALESGESNEVLEVMGVAVPEYRMIEKREEAFLFAEEKGWPVVLKLVAEKMLHKTESGGVVVGINSGEELEARLVEMEEKVKRLGGEMPGLKIMIQKQVEKGVEAICGVKRDETFGAVMMFGAGGILTELVADRNLHLLPVSRSEAVALIEGSRVYKLLVGYRGEKPYDVDGIVELMMRLARLVEGYEEVEEVEINPVIVTHERVWAVDGKILLRNHEEGNNK